MSQDAFLEDVAKQYEELAVELELAVAHCHTVATHFRNKELARAGAHGFSIHGHMKKAEEMLTNLAKLHAEKSTPHQSWLGFFSNNCLEYLVDNAQTNSIRMDSSVNRVNDFERG